MGTLFLVATPIGNLEDISARALRTLREVQLIAAEDTRHTAKLLRYYGISTSLTSYHDHNEAQKAAALLDALERGDVALVSDAGTPILSDPGFVLVQAALDAGHEVSPIPGPSAPLAALVASGLPAAPHLFLGYLPRRSTDRKKALKEVAGLPYTLLLLETPHRLAAALDDLIHCLGDRPIAVARELTKIYEEIFRGSIREAQERFREHPPRGEITIVVGGALDKRDIWAEGRLREEIKAYLTRGLPPSEVARSLARESGWARRQVYKLVQELRD